VTVLGGPQIYPEGALPRGPGTLSDGRRDFSCLFLAYDKMLLFKIKIMTYMHPVFPFERSIIILQQFSSRPSFLFLVKSTFQFTTHAH